MKKLCVIFCVSLIFSGFCGTSVLFGADEKYPVKPITLYVGFAAGGGGDITSRALAEVASKILGQPIVVLNKPGGGGSVALGELKNAKPDGYTIGNMTTSGIVTAALRKVTYQPVDDFDAILQSNRILYGLVVKADSPFKSLKDLIAYAKANPNKIRYGSSGVGSSGHLVMLLLADLFDIKWIHIPFGGGMEAVTALMGGNIDCSVQSSEWKSFVDSGRLRLLATPDPSRSEAFPETPTFIEQGYNITAPNTSCFVSPKGIPKDRLKILHDAFRKAVDDQGFKKALEKFDLPLDYKNSRDTEVIIKAIYDITRRLEGKIQK